MARVTVKGFDKIMRDLESIITPEIVNRRAADIENKTHVVTQAIIAVASMGVGPDGVAYPEYSPAYAKWKASKGPLSGRWLRGVGNKGRTGGMLDVKRFKAEIRTRGTLWIAWTALGSRMAIYGHVHQDGLPLGPGGPRKQRRWMHLQSEESRNAALALYSETLDQLVAEFNANRLKRT